MISSSNYFRKAKSEFAIIMATYNGEDYINEQLCSIKYQTYNNWALYISDDCSTDDTYKILIRQQAAVSDNFFNIKNRDRSGFFQNFMSLICDEEIEADFYVLSDQDDIWEKDRLEKAKDFLDQIDPSIPTLYCGRTSYINCSGQTIGLSDFLRVDPSFQNALVQNISSGNTMIMNKSARDLIMDRSNNINVDFHDWWIYLLISACGGSVVFDNRPLVKYRQHSKNTIGMNKGMKSKLIRLALVFSGRFREWNDRNIEALKINKDFLTEENKKSLDYYITSRKKCGFTSIFYLYCSKVHRQTFVQNVALYVSAFIGRL